MSTPDSTPDGAMDRERCGNPDGVPDGVKGGARDVVLEDVSVAEFLQHVTVLGEELFGEGPVACGVTSQHRRSTIAGSSPALVALDEVQYRIGDGPVLASMSAGDVVVVRDGHTDDRWPEYFGLTRSLGFASVLAAPLHVGSDGPMAVVFYAEPPDFFVPERQRMAGVFVEQARRALEMATQVARYQDVADDRRVAMESRTGIDIAVGIIIAQNKCTQEEAFELLKSVSNARGMKLRVVAEALIVQTTGKPSSTHFTT
ncbi:hypothetical protein IWX63_003314 [Arthrobacter sp. CAN_A2]|uniref:ANTAR domain-containing protein n=1 Tax=Arthrobacter sp. CAN_A2 TaxID=2787718 RepID=UPI0018EFD880